MSVTTLPEATNEVLPTDQYRRLGDVDPAEAEAAEAQAHATSKAFASLFETMLVKQREMNTKSYDAEWILKGRALDFDYGLQASQELAEFNESFGHGRWWGNTSTDFANCRTELVDALHFGMSMDLIKYGAEDYGCRTVAAIYSRACMNALKGITGAASHKDVTGWVKKLQAHVLTESDFNMALFYRVCLEVNMPIEILFNRYMGKAALNAFRQANGYSDKPRTYIKEWGTKLDGVANEDNFYVARYIDSNPRATLEDVTKFIAYTYEKVLQC